jgi:integrase
LRAHDLRATFVTISLAQGKSETWVTDRTGHKSSIMLYRYKRAARTHAEAELGALAPLHEAIPELRQMDAQGQE